MAEVLRENSKGIKSLEKKLHESNDYLYVVQAELLSVCGEMALLKDKKVMPLYDKFMSLALATRTVQATSLSELPIIPLKKAAKAAPGFSLEDEEEEQAVA